MPATEAKRRETFSLAEKILAFPNPKTFNDPFDCDCDLPAPDSKISLLWNAFNSLKYSGRGSTSVKKEDVENILKKNR